MSSSFVTAVTLREADTVVVEFELLSYISTVIGMEASGLMKGI